MSAEVLPIVRTVVELRAQVRAWRAAGETVAMTPTMGALHEGHLSLVRLARTRAGRVVASIFVNPAQFGPNEDFERYPRDEGGDARLLASAGCDLLYAPDVSQIYPPGYATKVSVSGVSEPLDGAARPGHFDGVATVVAKLLNQAQPDVAVFGEKDFQQLQLIRRLALDLDIPVEIIGAPIARDADGLALSSRNAYLSAAERPIAGMMNKVLADAAARLRAGDSVEKVEATGRAALERHGFDRVDYFEARQVEDLSPADGPPYEGRVRIFAAAHLGKTRL
ncbi:MAG: pantoate--beta-alanine ligase, partial [Caulobacterales bacterium 32-67-6]